MIAIVIAMTVMIHTVSQDQNEIIRYDLTLDIAQRFHDDHYVPEKEVKDR